MGQTMKSEIPDDFFFSSLLNNTVVLFTLREESYFLNPTSSFSWARQFAGGMRQMYLYFSSFPFFIRLSSLLTRTLYTNC